MNVPKRPSRPMTRVPQPGQKPTTSRTPTQTGKTTRGITQASGRAVAPKKSNTPLLIAACGGAALLLVVVVAVAASGGTPKKVAGPAKKAPAAAPDVSARRRRPPRRRRTSPRWSARARASASRAWPSSRRPRA